MKKIAMLGDLHGNLMATLAMEKALKDPLRETDGRHRLNLLSWLSVQRGIPRLLRQALRRG